MINGHNWSIRSKKLTCHNSQPGPVAQCDTVHFWGGWLLWAPKKSLTQNFVFTVLFGHNLDPMNHWNHMNNFFEHSWVCALKWTNDCAPKPIEQTLAEEREETEAIVWVCLNFNLCRSKHYHCHCEWWWYHYHHYDCIGTKRIYIDFSTQRKPILTTWTNCLEKNHDWSRKSRRST